jgi:very-short-patch-repair endonuclease
MARNKTPRALSPGEEAFALHCRAENLKVEREYRFYPDRKWQFDFAIPPQKIAVEIEGLSRHTSRHTTFKGYRSDCEKYNAAAKMGWRVLRYSTEMVLRGDAINDVLEMIT